MPKQKATKKLSEITFEHSGAAVALVGPAVGGAANGKTTLILKSTNGFSKETILKAQQIQVTLDIPEFLQKFFGLYYTDAQVLAQLMGYVPPATTEDPWSSTSYIDEQLASFTILKSLQKGNVVEQLQKLSEVEYIQLLEDQAMLEGVFKQATQAKPITKKTKPSQKETKGEPMTVEVEVNTEATELAEVMKALDSQKVELKKALDQITAFKEAEVQAIVKSKTARVQAIVKNVDHQAAIVKASLELESEDDFGAFLAAIQAMQTAVVSSEMFVEKGLNSDTDKAPETPVGKVLAVVKARIAKSQAK
jgi:hypothetical protein